MKLVSCLLMKAVFIFVFHNGGMAEWTNATVLKTVISATVSGVRIPLPPQRDKKAKLKSKETTRHNEIT